MTSRVSALLASASVVILAAGFLAGPARAEPLEKTAQAAMDSHPSVAAAFAARDAAIDDQDEKRSDYFPSFSAQGMAGREYGDNATSRGLTVTRGAGYSWLGDGSVTLDEPVFNAFATGHRVEAAQARRESANFGILDAREEIGFKAVMAYIDVLRGREAVKRLTEYGHHIDDYVKRIQGMVKQGGADAALAVQARDIRSQLDNTLAGAKGQLRTAIAKYTELAGYPPSDPMEKPAPPANLIPAAPDEAAAWAKDNHPMLLAAARTEKAAGRDIMAERGAYFPTVTAETSYRKMNQDDILGGELIDAKAVMRLNWNFALGGAEQARMRKTVAQESQSRAKYEETLRQITRNIGIAYSDSEAAMDQMDVQRKRVELNDELLKTQKSQFEASKVNLLQLLQTDNALFNARFALMNDEYSVLGSRYAILASMGRLQEALHLLPPVANGN
jgi:adhesin transport system outer membrane protein